MADIKEKLVDILRLKPYNMSEVSAGRLADHLIDNGVTILESNLKILESATDTNVGCKWISVEERLPEWTMPPRDVLVYHDLGCGMFVDRAWYSYEKNKWMSFRGMNLKVTHWMPLPEPPKGE